MTEEKHLANPRATTNNNMGTHNALDVRPSECIIKENDIIDCISAKKETSEKSSQKEQRNFLLMTIHQHTKIWSVEA